MFIKSPTTSASGTKERLLEIIWPTRCAICDEPGKLICDSCKASMIPYDPWLACPRCGAPWGKFQCSLCNSYTAGMLENPRRVFPLQSAYLFQGGTASVVRRFKDSNEQRLSEILAAEMDRALSPEVKSRIDVLVYIPCSEASLQKRGYDQMELLAQKLSGLMNRDVLCPFERPKSSDQRTLNRSERDENMRNAFRMNSRAFLLSDKTVLLVDDVITTGATMNAAGELLYSAGVKALYGLSFARVV